MNTNRKMFRKVGLSNCINFGIAFLFLPYLYIGGVNASILSTFVVPEGRVMQATTIGKVVNADGHGISDVTVREKGTNNTTATDAEGTFSLITTSSSATLVFTYIGYETTEVLASEAKLVTLIGLEDTIEEVVVVGYGTQRKSDLTGSISTVTSKELEQINSPNIVDKLQGKVAGLSINAGNAAPGQTAYINIRGENSISASNGPLIILDGIPFSGSLGDISPHSIENISVLKDASSTAIYGSRAANGVILITSKRGRVGKSSVNYNGYFGVQSVARRLNLMKGEQYLQYMHDFQIARGATGDALKPESYLFANVYEQWQKGIEVDWQDRIFKSAAPIQEHQLSFSGGSEHSTYFASLGYVDQEGVVKNSPYERINANLNLQQNINSWMKLGLTSQLNQSHNNGVMPSIENALKMSPYGRDKDDNGNTEYYPMYSQTLYPHPFANENAISEQTIRSIYANTFLDVALPIEGLSFKTTFGTNYRNNEIGSYYGSNTLNGRGMKGYGTIRNTNSYDWTWENLLTYDRTFGIHKLNAVGLYSAQASKVKFAEQYGEDFVVDNSYHNMAGAAANLKIQSGLTNTALVSYMGRVNYGLREKYLLTLTGRWDGYSAFSQDNKWAFFPSVAAAWIISGEDFYQSEALSHLKLRLSYGENGNQAISPYQTYDRLRKEPYIFGDGSAAVNGLIMGFDAIGNKKLKWETTRSFNAGIDFSAFNDRLSGNIDFYKTSTFDLLMSQQVPIMNGYNTIMSNIGKTENTGIEIALNSLNIQKGDFSWGSNLTFGYNKNKIRELRGDGRDDLANAWLIGHPIRVFYDYKVIGIWKEGDDIANSHQPSAKPGDAILADIDGDGKISASDRTVIGNKLPVYTLGFGNEFNYKKWSLSIFLNGAFDVKKEDYFINIERFLPGSGANYLANVDYWVPGNMNPEAPSPGYVPVNNHGYYLDASFLRIKDVSFSYTFDTSSLERLNIKSIRAFVNGRNLHTFTKVKGYNPEVLSVNNSGNPTSANVLNPYPAARVFTLGVNVQF